jgi:ribonuclease-3
LQELQQRIGISFNQIELLVTALTHPSFISEHPLGEGNNQRMEFLGDAVLGAVVADYIYRHYPAYPEGQLTKIRAAVVCEASLARLGEQLGLGAYLRLGRGEEASGGRQRHSSLADALEALTAAIFLDQGWETTRSFLQDLLIGEIERTTQEGLTDFKTSLQEMVQQHGNGKLNYVLISESGPDHAKEFVSGAVWRDQMLGKGSGRSKKEAEQQAARAALEKLRNKRPESEI